MTRLRLAPAALLIGMLALLLPSCGGDGGGNPAGPSGGGGGGGGGGGSTAATITITSSGVSPKVVTVTAGSRVTFVNNDNRSHDMSSDPHPDHTDCPAVTVGFVQPGQSATTQNLNTVRSCGYHDHNQPSETALMGTIQIQ
jgi:plastocyanin